MNYELRIKRNEEKILPYVWINGQETKFDLHIYLKSNSSVHVLGIFLGTGNNSVTFNTTVVHKGKNTKSRTTIRGVFLQHSQFSNDGMIRIVKGAKGADGYFASKILLFDDAKGRSVPSLEIDENDLKAGHASTVGRPDTDQLFYMQARGISEKEAERLIISGFFEPVLTFLSKNEQKIIKKQIASAL